MSAPKCPVTSEPQAIECVVAQLHRQMEHDYPAGQMRRDAHPKMHGCVQAEVTIDRDLPADLQHGLFAHPGKTYPAWIRYSNGFRFEPDLKADARGMAIKLLGVQGEFLGDEKDTQDFLAATFNAFFIPDAFRYVDFPAAAAKGSVGSTAFLLRRKLWRGLSAAFQSLNTLAMNPLAITYFSQAPFSLGPHVVKYQFKPVITESLGRSLPWSPLFQLKSGAVNVLILVLEVLGLTKLALRVAGFAAPPHFLHRELARSLQRCDGWFEILVQRQAAGMSIEDATQSWDTDVSPYRRVASVRIPRQVFSPAYIEDPDQKAAAAEVEALGENISMSPWHALREHEPVGSINRARRLAYPASSHFRHESNHVPIDPPTVGDYARLARIIRLAPDSVDPKPRAAVVEKGSSLAYLYLRRVPILIALAFVCFPLASVATGLRTFTQGIFDVHAGSMYLASFVAFQLAFAIMVGWWVITTYAHERWRVARNFSIYPIRLRCYAVAALLALPAVFATGLMNARQPPGRSDWITWAAAWIVGLAAALATSAAVQWLASQLPSVPPVKMLSRWVSRYPSLSDGYIDRERQQFLPGHLFAFASTIVALTIYVTIGALTLGDTSFSSVVFFLLLLLLLCLPLTGLTFFLDRFRIPSLTLMLALAVAAHGIRSAPHVFRLFDVSSPQPNPPTASSPSAFIVVTASGGGTQAAVWLTRVLAEIQDRCEHPKHPTEHTCDLFSAIRLISGTSGGSVGAMYVASAYENGRMGDKSTSLQNWAAESVEDPLWRALIYRDIYRPLRAFTSTVDYDDRAQALERAWRRHIGDVGVSDWTLDAASGRRPAVIFNTTVQSSGRRVLISTAGNVPGRNSPINFSDIYPGKGIDIATAVRLSSTFPLVVPFARDGQHLQPTRFVDGGYSDLFGVASATEWLQSTLSGSQVKPDGERTRVLLLQVRTPFLRLPVTMGFPNWADQFDDDQTRIALLRSGLNSRACISTVSFELGGDSAIEWHITAAQLADIDDQWKRGTFDPAIESVIAFLNGPCKE